MFNKVFIGFGFTTLLAAILFMILGVINQNILFIILGFVFILFTFVFVLCSYHSLHIVKIENTDNII